MRHQKTHRLSGRPVQMAESDDTGTVADEAVRESDAFL